VAYGVGDEFGDDQDDVADVFVIQAPPDEGTGYVVSGDLWCVWQGKHAEWVRQKFSLFSLVRTGTDEWAMAASTGELPL
jgi:hypothetical protein